jgi:hypothetical protein
MKKGDYVADNEDDDVVRNSVTATVCTEELILRTRYIYVALSTYHTGQMWKWGGGIDGQHDTFSGPSWVSHIPAGPPCDLQGF